MYTGIRFLEQLDDAHVDWLLRNGREIRTTAGELVFDADTLTGDIYLVLSGLLSVVPCADAKHQIAIIGPGEIIGEISFLDNERTSAAVVADEDSLLYAIPKTLLGAKIEEDPSFSACFHRALAYTLNYRLRNSVAGLGLVLGEDGGGRSIAVLALQQLLAAVDEFKSLAQAADKSAIEGGGTIEPQMANRLQQKFHELSLLMNHLIGDDSELGRQERREIGYRAQRELLPFLLLAVHAERAYSKPRGYAGDFLTIEAICRNKAEGGGRLGELIDRCFLDTAVSKAIRHRPAVLVSEILKTVEQGHQKPVSVTSLGCGPAPELFDVFGVLEGDRELLIPTLVDFDLKALAFVLDRCEGLGLEDNVRLLHGHIIDLAMGREKVDIRGQDLIYSGGLVNSFSDKLALKVINLIYDFLRPGGRALVANFHVGNPSKALLDYVLDWRLSHRSEKDMNRLFSESKFGKSCTNIRFDADRVCLFAECVK